MKRILLLLLPVLFMYTAAACPHCNIHNYMYASICSAKNVFKGVVVRKDKRGICMVRVMEVYKGAYAVDTLVEAPGVYLEKKDTGIVCTDIVDAFEPIFRHFDTEAESEIRYLVRNDSMARSLTEARTCIYGISGHSVDGGMKYFKYHYASAFPTLCNLLDSVLNGQVPFKGLYYSDWQSGNVIRAYFSDTCSGSKTFLMEALECFVNDTNFSPFPGPSRSKGDLISNIIRASKKFYGDELAQWTRKKLATCGFYRSGPLMYALLDSHSNSSDEVLNMLKPEQYETYARVLYDLAQEQFRWWQWKKGSETLEKARSITTSKYLEEQIKKLEERYSLMTGKKK